MFGGDGARKEAVCGGLPVAAAGDRRRSRKKSPQAAGISAAQGVQLYSFAAE